MSTTVLLDWARENDVLDRMQSVLDGNKELEVAYKGLVEIPVEISGLEHLRRIYVYGNQLTNFPWEISQLQILNISSNELIELPPKIEELKNLKYLLIGNNQLTKLPPEIGKLKNLKELDVNRNHLRELPPEISELKILKRLDVGHNHLTELSLEIIQLEKLQELNVSNNQLLVLPAEFGCLNLIYLSIRDNPLAEGQPTSIEELQALWATVPKIKSAVKS